MEGEDSESDSSRAFGNKPVWKRMIVIVAGAFMNILLGFVIIITLTCMDSAIPTTIVDSFHTDDGGKLSAQSYDCGLREGDRIVEINGMSILSVKDLQYALVSANSEKCDVEVKRNGERITLKNVVFKDNANESIIDFFIKGQKKTPLSVLSYSAKDTVSTAKLVWVSLKDLMIGKYGLKDMSGPVGLVNAIGNAAGTESGLKDAVMSILSLSALITINLGIINLLPIPALDGGRFLFLVVEAIRRKPVKPEHEGAVHLIGMALIMLLIVAVTFNDIKNLIGR